jgi:outer membrane receptor protein involved in Fe transport
MSLIWSVRAVAGGVCLLALVGSPLAQTYRGTLSGAVTDPDGAAVVQATVTAINRDTGVAQEARADARGTYRLLNLEPGQYQLVVAHPGFETYVREPITIPVAGNLTLDVALTLGQVTDEVQVVAEAPLLETGQASFGQVVNQRAIEELPLNSRNPMLLVTLSPGIATGSNFSSDGIGATNIESGRDQYAADFSIGGGKTLSNEVLLDGAPNTSVDRGYMAYIPPVDSTQEFKVQANAFSAEFGRTTGGVVNIVTKGGTNQLRGTLYEFHRNSALDAHEFFSNRSDLPDPPSWERNQFGGNVGGPIRRNKTFFFANYEGLRQAIPFVLTSTVPTVLQRQGDFSETRAPNGELIAIYDPASLQRLPDGRLMRSPFPGNVIPADRLDPVGQAVAGYYPAPNVPGDPVTNANNYVSVNNATANMNNYGARIDHHFAAGNRLSGRVSYRKDTRVAANQFEPGNPASATGAPTDISWNVMVSDLHTFSPTMTGEIRASFARHHTSEISPSFGFDTGQLRFPQGYVDTALPFFPKVNLSDAQNLGRDRYYDQIRDTISVQANITKLAGRHSLKAGADYRLPRFQLDRNLNSAGTFTFNRGFTQGPDPLSASASAGHSLASLLLGTGSGGSLTHTDAFTLNRQYYGFFLQDDWAITRRLTLNLGVRYSLEVGQTESRDRMAFLDLDATNPLSERVGIPFTGLLGYVGTDGNSRNLLDTDTNNFAPRVGFAFQLNDRTTVRGGYGIFYAPQWISAYDTNVYAGFNSTTEWVTTLDNITPLNTLSDPFPQGFNLPSGERDPLANTGQAISGWTRDERVGYTQQWNLTLQRQLGERLVVEAAYWASRALKQENRSGWQENQLPNEHLALGNALNELVPNPFYGIIEQGALSSPEVSRRQLLLPYPQYTSVVRTGVMAGNSLYNAFTIRAEKRLSGGLSLLTSYTFSKTIDDFDARPLDSYNRDRERALSTTDVPHRLVLGGIYELPFGRGKRFGDGMHPLVDAFLGGWTLSGIATYQSGFPVSIGRPAVNNGQSAALENPDIDQWFDTSVFSPAEPFTFGNVGRTQPDVRTDSVKNLDLTLTKTFTLMERYRLRFRVDSFNVTNTPQFGAPNGSVTSPAFGQVSSTANRPRSIQFGAQLVF